MKKIYYYVPVALFALGTTFSCNEKVDKPIQTFTLSNIDSSFVPGDDFYGFSTNGWAKLNPIKDEYARYGSFDQLAEQNDIQVRGIIEELGKGTHKAGSNAQKIGDLYKIATDSTKLNNDGALPIKDQLAQIANTNDRSEMIKLIAEVNKYASTPFFGLYVGADDKNSTINILHLNQGGLSLGDRDYYLNEDEHSKEIRKGYIELMNKQFVNAGYSAEEASKAAQAVIKLETELAKSHFTKEDRRKPELNYNKLSVKDLDSKVAKFEWTSYFEAAGLKGFEDLNVSQIKPIAAAVNMINTASLDDIKAYLSWKIINSASPYLSDTFSDANFEFFGKQLSGRQAQQPRWKRAVNTVNGVLSEAVGEIYVSKYFPAESKERMLTLVKNLQITFGERINNLTWMSDATKAKAQEKLNAFSVKIGYPDKWKDYNSLEIKEDSYWANIVRASIFEYNDNISRLGKAVDKTEWHMPPQMVNAYYNPSSNEICFPAGILQPPFFYADGDDAINYGAIGVVIGHEMTHGFDDQGAKFDKEGNLQDWWTAEDVTKFNERSQVLVNHFNNIEVLPGLNANGQFTLGENIADYGGLQISYNAFSKTEEAQKAEKLDGYTPQQRFFLAYSAVWAGNIREAEIRRRTQMDVHSLGKWRVNGTLPHINAWYQAFGVTPENALFIPQEERADIW